MNTINFAVRGIENTVTRQFVVLLYLIRTAKPNELLSPFL